MRREIITLKIEDLFPKDETICKEIRKSNQKAIQSVPVWLKRSTWEKSLWNYGVPPNCFDSVNSEAFDSPNYTDLLCLFSKSISMCSYLEVGVSSGRNIFPLLQFLDLWDCVALDIERANPSLINALNATASNIFPYGKKPFKNKSGETEQVSIERTEYSLKNSTNQFSYVRGDKFQSDTWELLLPKKFSLIFSDACHIPSSLTTELSFLIQNDLLEKNELVFIWDDLHAAQLAPHREVVSRLFELYFDKSPIALHTISSGTYGPRRRIGIFSSDRKLIPFGLEQH